MPQEASSCVAASIRIVFLIERGPKAVRKLVVTINNIFSPLNPNKKTNDKYSQNHNWVVDLFRFIEPLHGLYSDGEAERDQEHGVDEGAQHLSPGPPECVLTPGFWRHSH